MKILYAIQGTGNGHITKAIEIVPRLMDYAHVDVLVSGTNYQIQLPFNVKYKFYGISFFYNSSGGLDYWKTLRKLKIFKFLNDVRTLPVNDYDLVISDFEPVSVWACHLTGKEVVGFGHQASFAYQDVPLPQRVFSFGKFILNYYAPCTHNVGVHFKSYNQYIFTPIIRKSLREIYKTERDYVTVYLPSVGDDVVTQVLGRMVEIPFQIYSKQTTFEYKIQNLHFFPAQPEKFMESIAGSKGVITQAGFETPAEALFLGKKLLVVPIKGQYEQYCNAEALKQLGVKVLDKLDLNSIKEIYNWYYFSLPVKIEFEDQTTALIQTLLSFAGFNLLLCAKQTGAKHSPELAEA